MKTQAIVLAAGESARFRGIKQLALIDDKPLINHVLGHFTSGQALLSGLDSLTVVLGANAELISPVLPKWARIQEVAEWREGMGHSLGMAAKDLEDDTSHVLIVLADQVAIGSDQFERMLSVSEQFDEKIIAASYSEDIGVPAIFPRVYFEELKALKGDRGAKQILKHNTENLIRFDLNEAVVDIDTQDDLRSWIEANN